MVVVVLVHGGPLTALQLAPVAKFVLATLPLALVPFLTELLAPQFLVLMVLGAPGETVQLLVEVPPKTEPET